jgi:hypothetical protein
VNRRNISKSCAKIFKFLCGPPISLYKYRKLYWGWNKWAKGLKSSFNEPIRNMEDRQVAKTTDHKRLIFKGIEPPDGYFLAGLSNKISTF